MSAQVFFGSSTSAGTSGQVSGIARPKVGCVAIDTSANRPSRAARTIIVAEPDPTELLAGEEDSGVADDCPPVDDPIVTDAPVVTADTDTLIDELIEELDEGAGEVT